jgi:hypothetical protein
MRNSFDDSRVFHMLALSVPAMKIFMAVGALIPGDYACFSTKQMWLVCMIGHDMLHSYIIWIKLQAARMRHRLGLSGSPSNVAAAENANANENNLNGTDFPLNEMRPREVAPQQQQEQEDSIMIPIQSPENENGNRAPGVQEWMEMKARAQKLTKICT